MKDTATEEKKARERFDAEASALLNELPHTALDKTGFSSIHSLNAKIGAKHRHYLNIRMQLCIRLITLCPYG